MQWIVVLGEMCQEHGIFQTFLCLFFTTFALFYPPTLFSLSFTLQEKRYTCYWSHDVAEHNVQLQWMARFKKLSKRPSLRVVYNESISPSSFWTISPSRTSPSSPDRRIVRSRRYPPPAFTSPLSWPEAIQRSASLLKSSTKEWYLRRSITVCEPILSRLTWGLVASKTSLEPSDSPLLFAGLLEVLDDLTDRQELHLGWMTIGLNDLACAANHMLVTHRQSCSASSCSPINIIVMWVNLTGIIFPYA